MPTGPQGQKRPRDMIGRAVMIGRISVGEIEDPGLEQPEKTKRKKTRKQARASARRTKPAAEAEPR